MCSGSYLENKEGEREGENVANVSEHLITSDRLLTSLRNRIRDLMKRHCVEQKHQTKSEKEREKIKKENME